MEKIVKQLAELSANVSQLDRQNVTVSNASIGWQIDHSLRVMNQIIAALIRSNPDEYKPKFNWPEERATETLISLPTLEVSMEDQS